MLRTLSIRNFVLIEEATLELGEGLTVLSGETGAGKTLLTQALELLLGERATGNLVGTSGDEALIQGGFQIGDDELRAIPEDIVQQAGLSSGEIVATRRLSQSGRNRCYLNGTAATLDTLGNALGHLLSFSGQHEHRRLVNAAYQREMLDLYAGRAALEVRRKFASAWGAARRAEGLLREGERDREERRREKELLRFQVDELEQAALSPDEEEALQEEQQLLARAEELLETCGQVAEILKGESSEVDAGELAGAARRRIEALRGIDAELDGIVEQVAECEYLLDETARNVRSYAAGIEVDSGRLSEVEERLREYTGLARKYGGSTAEALAFLEGARNRLRELENREEDLGELKRARDENRARAIELASKLTQMRAEAAPRLEESVASHLEDLGMPDGRFQVDIEEMEQWGELHSDGADTVEFLVAPNPGHPPRSLARTASGGELSRILLALKAALAGLESREAIVLDEIDAGIGGRTALEVGRKLHELSRDCQVLVITHLPQIAAYADSHYMIEKLVRDGETATSLRLLEEEETIRELSRMMGGNPDDPAALDHARSLKDRAARGLVD